MYNSFKTFFPLAIAAMLIGCGGGGGGGGTPALVVSTSTFPLRAMGAADFQQSGTLPFSMSGKFGGTAISGSGTVTSGNVTSTTFEGQPALQRVTSISATFTANGTTYPLNTTSTSYVDTNYLPLGSSSGYEYTVVNGTANIPVAAKVNDTGTLFTVTRYTDSTKVTQLGTATVTFALLPDTATTAILKVIWQYKDNTSTVTHTSSSTSRITDTGSFTRLSDDASYTNGDNLTMTY